MSTIMQRSPGIRERTDRRDVRSTEGRMYAIAFDLDIEPLRNDYGDPYNNA